MILQKVLAKEIEHDQSREVDLETAGAGILLVVRMITRRTASTNVCAICLVPLEAYQSGDDDLKTAGAGSLLQLSTH
jgi:hypothetical protein